MAEKKEKPRRNYGEGSITERSDGRWQVSVPGTDGKRRYNYADNPKDAEKLRRAMLQEVEQGKQPPSKQPFRVHYEEWLEMRKHDFKPNTYIDVVSCFRAHFLPAFGALPLKKLTAAHIQRLYNRLQDKGLSPNTIQTYHTRLKICLNFAVKQKKISSNPCDNVELPKKRKSKNGCLTAEEAMQVMEAISKHPLLAALVPLALASEARESELLALTWDDVDFERGLIRIDKTLTRTLGGNVNGRLSVQTVTPKSESGTRDITLPPFAMEALRNHRTAQIKKKLGSGIQNQKNLVFPSKSGGYRWTHDVWQAFKIVVRKLGFDITFHDLRHTGATLGLEQGISPLEMQHRLGHADIETTLGVYGHVTQRMQDQATDTLQNIFTEKKNTDFEAI